MAPRRKQPQAALAAVGDNQRNGDAHLGEVGQVAGFDVRPVPAEGLPEVPALRMVSFDIVVAAAHAPFDDVAKQARRHLRPRSMRKRGPGSKTPPARAHPPALCARATVTSLTINRKTVFPICSPGPPRERTWPMLKASPSCRPRDERPSRRLVPADPNRPSSERYAANLNGT